MGVVYRAQWRTWRNPDYTVLMVIFFIDSMTIFHRLTMVAELEDSSISHEGIIGIKEDLRHHCGVYPTSCTNLLGVQLPLE